MMMMMLFSRVLGVRCVFFSSRVVVKKRVVCFCDKTEKKILGKKETLGS